MFTIICRRCDERFLVGSRSIRSLHNTSDGPVGYVDAPCGHLVVHEFRSMRSRPADDDAPAEGFVA